MKPMGETDLEKLLKTMNPKLNAGEYVFCVVDNLSEFNPNDFIMHFIEDEGNTIILKRELADRLNLKYTFIAAWITLTVHSSLAAVGLTSAFSSALSKKGISCNVVAAFYHDHIFVDKKDAEEAMQILKQLAS